MLKNSTFRHSEDNNYWNVCLTFLTSDFSSENLHIKRRDMTCSRDEFMLFEPRRAYFKVNQFAPFIQFALLSTVPAMKTSRVFCLCQPSVNRHQVHQPQRWMESDL